MLAQFVEAIGNLATRAKTPTLLADPSNPRVTYLLHDGQMTSIDNPKPIMRADVETTNDLLSAVQRFGGKSASLWHDRLSIVAVLDDGDRRESVTIELVHSDQFLALGKLPRNFDQRALVLFLKRELCGAIDEGLLPIFRSIDFRRSEGAVGKLEHGDESLGRSVQAAVEGRGEIPEFLTATVPVYANPGLRIMRPVRLSVDINVHDAVIQLTPLPDELKNAVSAAQLAIGEVLAAVADDINSDGDTTASVFFGVPRFYRQEAC